MDRTADVMDGVVFSMIIAGKAQPQERSGRSLTYTRVPRGTDGRNVVYGGDGRAYKVGIHSFDPARSRNFKQSVRLKARSIMVRDNMAPYAKGVPLLLEMTIVRRVPSSWSKAKTDDALSGRIRPTTKPDLSNQLKAIEDALNGVVYHDDSAIVREVIEKRYGTSDLTILTVSELDIKPSF